MRVVAKACVWDVVAFTGMVMVEACTIGLTIMTKTVMAKGMSPFVFVFYSNALSSLIIILSSSIFCHRSVKPPPLSLSLLSKFFLLGLTGVTISQNCAFTALNYSSPILACAMGHLLPTFSFLLSVISRSGKPDLRSPSSQAKAIGTLISAMGASLVILYKGPAIRNSSPAPSPSLQLRLMQQPLLFASTPEHWVLGALFFALASLSVSVWNVIQAGTIREYSEGMTILSFYSVFGTIQSAVVSLIAERDLSAWKLNNRLEITNIILAAIFGSVIRSNIHGWCIRWKGPIYVAMFKPFGIVVAITFGVIFFGNSLHIGSVIGTIIMAIGYYSLIWGQIKEEEMYEDSVIDGNSQSSSHKVPLLQDDIEV